MKNTVQKIQIAKTNIWHYLNYTSQLIISKFKFL